MTTTVPYNSMSRPKQLFTHCCCCFPLRVGCFILAYSNLIFNTFRTVGLIAGIRSGTNITDSVDDSSEDNDDSTEALIEFVVVLMVVCGNVAWLLVNKACIIGLHMRRTGPIRVYIGFAIARQFLNLVGFALVALYDTDEDWNSTENIIANSIDFGLPTYFVLVYYVYADQLEREQKDMERRTLPTTVNDVAFIYPTKLDKETLVTNY